jgi:protein-disulfide isomerase
VRLPFPRMPSGKRARQQRQAAAATAGRTPPPVRSKGAGGSRARQASPKALGIAGGVALVVIIAIVLAVVLSSGGSKSSSANTGPLPTIGNAHWAGAMQGAPEANALFKGIPQQGLVLGKPSAPVEMEMFIDVQCPICRDYEVNSLPEIVQKYIRTGKVQLHLQPWAFIGPQSKTGRLGVIAASFQNKGFEFAKVMYDNQPDNSENTGYLNDDWMGQIAASVNGLKVQKVLSQKNDSAASTIAGKVDQLAKAANVQGTPTVLIGPTGGKLQDIMPPGYAPTLQITKQALDQALANAGA